MTASELETSRKQLEINIGRVVKDVPPSGPANYRETGFNTPSYRIEAWARKFLRDPQFNEMLVSDSARIVVATNDEYKQKPWLGLNFWGKPEVHPPLERVTMKLSYHDGRSTGDM